MIEQQQKQDLTPTMEELMAQMARMQAELNELKTRATAVTSSVQQPQPVQEARLVVSTTRRTALRRLAGGMLAGLALAGGAALPESAEAKLVVNVPGQGGRIGAVITADGTNQIINNFPVGTTYKYGLVVLSGTGSYDLSVAANVIPFTTGVFAVGDLSGYSSGVYGRGTYGVYGKGTYGVYGEAIPGSTYGVYGSSSGSDSTGVLGVGYYGVQGNGIYGVYGYGSGTGGTGVYGTSNSYGQAGYFQGAVTVTGMLTKPAGSFKIDHPLDPANKYLYHSFVESPDMKNIYDGVVKLDGQGSAVMQMPDWFEALNTDFRYQLTPVGGAMPNLHISQKMKDRVFKIGGGLAGQEISWMVTGIRQDIWARAHRIPVEEVKTGEEQGHYLHPEEHGHGPDKSVDPLRRNPPKNLPKSQG